MNNLLEITGINKFYESFHAVKNLSFKLGKGEICGFLGPNGSGKTTTIKILAGLLPRYTGAINYKNTNLRNIGNCKEIKFIFDSQNFYDSLSAFENLAIIAKLNRSYNRKRILETLETLGLSGWENKKVQTFSRGMRQRLALATAEYEIPDLLVLDEPTNGLDIAAIHSLEQYFKNLNQTYGCSILVSSHYLEQIERLSQHIIIICLGEKTFDGSIDEFKRHKQKGIKFTLKKTIQKELINQVQASLANLGFSAQYEKEITTDDTSNICSIVIPDLTVEAIDIISDIFLKNIGIRYIEPIYSDFNEFFQNKANKNKS